MRRGSKRNEYCMLDNLHAFYSCPLLIFAFKITFFKNSLHDTIKVSNSLGPNQPNISKGLSRLNFDCMQIVSSRKRVKIDDVTSAYTVCAAVVHGTFFDSPLV